MNYLDQTYNPAQLENLRRTIQAHLVIASRFWLHNEQQAAEFRELFNGLLHAHAPTNTAEFDHVFQLAVLRWRLQWLDLAESEWMAAEGQRFDCHLNRHPRAVHTPNLDLLHEITRQGYPVLYSRIRVYQKEGHRIERRLGRLQKASTARQSEIRRRAQKQAHRATKNDLLAQC